MPKQNSNDINEIISNALNVTSDIEMEHIATQISREMRRGCKMNDLITEASATLGLNFEETQRLASFVSKISGLSNGKQFELGKHESGPDTASMDSEFSDSPKGGKGWEHSNPDIDNKLKDSTKREEKGFSPAWQGNEKSHVEEGPAKGDSSGHDTPKGHGNWNNDDPALDRELEVSHKTEIHAEKESKDSGAMDDPKNIDSPWLHGEPALMSHPKEISREHSGWTLSMDVPKPESGPSKSDSNGEDAPTDLPSLKMASLKRKAEDSYREAVESIAQEAVQEAGGDENRLHDLVFEMVDSSQWITYNRYHQQILDESQNEPDGAEVASMAGEGADWRKQMQVAAFMAMEADVMQKAQELMSQGGMQAEECMGTESSVKVKANPEDELVEHELGGSLENLLQAIQQENVMGGEAFEQAKLDAMEAIERQLDHEQGEVENLEDEGGPELDGGEGSVTELSAMSSKEEVLPHIGRTPEDKLEVEADTTYKAPSTEVNIPDRPSGIIGPESTEEEKTRNQNAVAEWAINLQRSIRSLKQITDSIELQSKKLKEQQQDPVLIGMLQSAPECRVLMEQIGEQWSLLLVQPEAKGPTASVVLEKFKATIEELAATTTGEGKEILNTLQRSLRSLESAPVNTRDIKPSLRIAPTPKSHQTFPHIKAPSEASVELDNNLWTHAGIMENIGQSLSPLMESFKESLQSLLDTLTIANNEMADLQGLA